MQGARVQRIPSGGGFRRNRVARRQPVLSTSAYANQMRLRMYPFSDRRIRCDCFSQKVGKSRAGCGVRCPVPGAWCPVLGARCSVLGARCLVPRAWRPVLGARCSVLGAWCPVLGARCLVLRVWCCVLGARCPVLGAQCLVLSAWCSVLRAWCSVLRAPCSVLGCRLSGSPGRTPAPDAARQTPHSRCRTPAPDAARQTPHARRRTPDAAHQTPHTRRRTPLSRHTGAGARDAFIPKPQAPSPPPARLLRHGCERGFYAFVVFGIGAYQQLVAAWA